MSGRTLNCPCCGEPLLVGADGTVSSPEQTKPAFTERETEVLRMLATGHSNKEIAGRLGVSTRTVETHRLNLRRKTRTGARSELVVLARGLGLVAMAEAA